MFDVFADAINSLIASGHSYTDIMNMPICDMFFLLNTIKKINCVKK